MKYFFIILSIFLGLQNASADLAGRVRLEESRFWKNQISPNLQYETNIDLQFEEKDKLSDVWRFRLEPKVHVSTSPKRVDVPLDYDFRDTLIEGKFESFAIQAGSFIKVWEGTDGLNPMDIASMKNLRDPFSVENLGSWGLAATTTQGILTLDLLYVPWQTVPRLPGDNSPWWPQKAMFPLVSDNQELLLPAEPAYQIAPHNTLNSAFKDNYGGRLQAHLDSWDFSLGAFEGAAQIPLFGASINGNLIQTSPSYIVQILNPIQVQPIDYRRRSVSGAAVATLDSWILRVAGKHDQPMGVDPLLPSWSEQFVGGIEKSVVLFEQSVIFSAQYAYGKQAQSQNGLLYIADPFENSFLYGVRWSFTDDLLVYFAGLLDNTFGASYDRLSIEKKLGSTTTLECRADWIQGSPKTLLGMWGDQGRLSIATLFQF